MKQEAGGGVKGKVRSHGSRTLRWVMKGAGDLGERHVEPGLRRCCRSLRRVAENREPLVEPTAGEAAERRASGRFLLRLANDAGERITDWTDDVTEAVYRRLRLRRVPR